MRFQELVASTLMGAILVVERHPSGKRCVCSERSDSRSTRSTARSGRSLPRRPAGANLHRVDRSSTDPRCRQLASSESEFERTGTHRCGAATGLRSGFYCAHKLSASPRHDGPEYRQLCCDWPSVRCKSGHCHGFPTTSPAAGLRRRRAREQSVSNRPCAASGCFAGGRYPAGQSPDYLRAAVQSAGRLCAAQYRSVRRSFADFRQRHRSRRLDQQQPLSLGMGGMGLELGQT